MQSVCTVDDWEPQKNEKGTYFFRANTGGTFTEDPGELHVVEPRYSGLACFCDAETIHPWWTYFEVAGHTKRGTGVHVKPVYGDMNELAKVLTAAGQRWSRVIMPSSFGNRPKKKEK